MPRTFSPDRSQPIRTQHPQHLTNQSVAFSPKRVVSPPTVGQNCVRMRQFHRPRFLNRVSANQSQDGSILNQSEPSPSSVRRRLFDEEEDQKERKEGSVEFLRLPVIRKKAETSPEEVRHNVKKLKTTSTCVNINNNDVSQEEDPLVLAKALSKVFPSNQNKVFRQFDQ